MNLSRLSIRARITGGSLLIAILISIVAGIVIFAQVQRIVSDGQERLLEGIEGPYVTAIHSGDTEEMDLPGPGQFVAVVDPTGQVVLNTLPNGLADAVTTIAGEPDGVRTIGEDYLVRSTSVTTADGLWHVITASMNDDEVLREVALLLIGSLTVINLAFGAAAWLIGSAALAPVTRLRRSAEELVAAPGTDLLPVGPAKDEISELASTLNELIGDLRTSAERERQIVSDASHEFRTPLAIIQTRLELAQRQATSLADMKADVTAAQKTVARLSSLATSMLELSRIDSQAEPGRASIAELAAELADAADRGRHRAAGLGIRIDYTAETHDDDAIAFVSEPDFGRVCDNLVGNALDAVGEEGTIEMRLVQEAGSIRLSVSDDGGGMDPAYVPHAFDRFSRESTARTRGGAGLGLSIVAGIASVSGGTATLDNVPGVGLRVDVAFPVARVET
ncbi:sensor histidine kinase [Microbacterium trichothecenolyticum]|uniref:histidine kinase n=1 Tax=Microbacterium trichothecenolyticum TaxID=69370 RepID=A0A0M2HBA9_MICTR|nr:HAMP domain-containing sensor histidine kinase [Microbacterium trichothecenolyticum]KJL43774.1 Signal transduction histidine-protein kinase ArlS [Microbacterium trichothecenolyticum]